MNLVAAESPRVPLPAESFSVGSARLIKRIGQGMSADEFIAELKSAMVAGEECREMLSKMDAHLRKLYSEIDDLKRSNENLDGRCKWLYSRFDYLFTEIKKISDGADGKI